ncbi:MAG: hypothetical protein ABSG03_11260 [Bryobacteraceae bacterium]
MAKKGDNCVVIDVDDTGLGIPSEICDRVFHPLVAAGKVQGSPTGASDLRQTVLDPRSITTAIIGWS